MSETRLNSKNMSEIFLHPWKSHITFAAKLRNLDFLKSSIFFIVFCLLSDAELRHQRRLFSVSSTSSFACHRWLRLSVVDHRRRSQVVVDSKEVIEIMKNFRPNFRRLVLFCMDSYDSESRRILQHFSRSTRFAILCTAPISNFQQKKISKLFPNFVQNSG